jgi:hypothetical protein
MIFVIFHSSDEQDNCDAYPNRIWVLLKLFGKQARKEEVTQIAN